MNFRRPFLLFALAISAITFAVVGVWRHHARHLVLLTAFSLTASAQNVSSFLDSSRVTNGESAGVTIPNYTANCLVQPVLVADSSAAATISKLRRPSYKVATRDGPPFSISTNAASARP